MAFSRQTTDFLFENRLHDSKEWFGEHKADFAAYVTQPFAELINALSPTMRKIDPEIICDPKKLSRIYCDARYARESVFREEMWYTFSRPRENAYAGHPGFWFAISPSGINYGCGYYCAGGAVKDAIRKMILSDDESFKAAFLAVEGQRTFRQYGELYKKNRYPLESPEKCAWLNRKNYGVSYATDDPEIMFSDTLYRRVARDFKKIAPLYDFFVKAETNARAAEMGVDI